MDSTADLYICNNLKLMTDFAKRLIIVGRLILNEVSLGRGTIQIRLALENRIKGIISTFTMSTTF